MSTELIRVGVIGAGGIARSVHLPALADMDDVRVVAICDLVQGRAAAQAEKYGIPNIYAIYHDMLAHETLDAIFVLVEPGNLFHVVWSCLDAGLPTFMEKPPGIDLYQAQSLARKSAETGRILQVGFNRRHIPLVRHVVDLVRARTAITQVEGCFMKYGDGAFDRGALSAFASDTIHAVDLMRAIAGGAPVSAASVIGQYDEYPTVNAWNGVCRFDNGVTGTIKANYRVGGRIHRFEVHGPGVSAYINLGFGPQACDATVLSYEGAPQYSLAAQGTSPQGILRIDGMELAGSTEFYRYYGFYQEDRHFIDCVRSGTPPETGIDDAVKSMALVQMFVDNEI
ncbi:MAG: Gfo/Idh/MocA family oxidoreductase [Anaerolineae bacterium]|nr:Gfo/Idh/MocA family oxidoreductase [Anaerolineae bacterium]